MSANIEFKFPNLRGIFLAAEEEIWLFMAAEVQTNRGLLFDAEGARNGHDRWAPLKLRKGQILSDRGVLRKSIAPYNPNGSAGPQGYVSFRENEIIIGSQVMYASLMNDGTTKMPGGVMRPKNAKALKIPLPAGKNATDEAKQLRKGAKTLTYEAADGVRKKQKYIFRKYVRIPARNFTEWNDQDAAELQTATENKIIEVLNRAES